MPGGITRVGDIATTVDPCNFSGVTTIAGPGAVGLTGVIVNGKPAAMLGDLTAPYPSGIPPVCVPITKPIIGPGAPGATGGVYINGKIVSTLADTVGTGVVTQASGVDNPLTGVFAGTIVAGPPIP